MLTSYAEAKEEITPDSTKSTQDKIKETVTDTGDRVARGVQPDDNKGAGQTLFDKTQRAHDNDAHGGATSSVYETSPIQLDEDYLELMKYF